MAVSETRGELLFFIELIFSYRVIKTHEQSTYNIVNIFRLHEKKTNQGNKTNMLAFRFQNNETFDVYCFSMAQLCYYLRLVQLDKCISYVSYRFLERSSATARAKILY